MAEKKPIIYEYWSRLDRVIDGDTIVVFCDQGFDSYANPHIRLDGINTPEVYGENKPYGEIVRQHVVELLAANDNQMYVRTKFNQSFNRWVGDIFLQGESLADIIYRNGWDKETFLKNHKK